MFRADRTGSASVFGLCPGCNRWDGGTQSCDLPGDIGYR